MNTKPAAYIISLVAVYTVYHTIKAFRQDRLSTSLFVMWTLTWCAVGLFAPFPFLFDRVMGLLHMGSRPFFITVGALLFLFGMVFNMSSHISRTNRRMTKLVQEVSLLKFQLEQQARREAEDGER